MQNDLVFNHNPVNPLVTISLVTEAWNDFQNALISEYEDKSSPSSIPLNPTPMAIWKALPRGSFKVNCDVAISKNSTHRAVVAVLRNDRGRVLDGLTRLVSLSFFLPGESLAIRLACLLANAHKLHPVENKNDNRTATLVSVFENVSP
ncbi:hypothetical protein ACSBR1_004191 [Camellia fascicularis]